MPPSAMGEDPFGNRLQGQYFVHAAPFDCLVRHAEDNTRCFVLGDGVGAGLLHLEHAVGAVVAHPGEDNPDRILPRIARRGAEQHVDRRTVAANQRPVLNRFSSM
jgi:hypothetical protein